MVQFCSRYPGAFPMCVAQVNFIKLCLNPLFVGNRRNERANVVADGRQCNRNLARNYI